MAQTRSNALDLSEGWIFRRSRMPKDWLSDTGPVSGDGVDLPHCWNDRETFQDGRSYYRGYGSYRKVFSLRDMPVESGTRRLTLNSGGFYGTGDVWLNGIRIARVDGQYLGFRIALKEEHLSSGENALGIRLSNRYRPDTLPGIEDPDFLLYGGLAGRVWIDSAPLVRLTRGDTAVRTVFGPSGPDSVKVFFTVTNDTDSGRSCDAEWILRAADGSVQGRSTVVETCVGPRGVSERLCADIAVSGAELWSPGAPVLYTAECRVMSDGMPEDGAVERFGFRTAEFRQDSGFFLNGERTFLRGCNRHESMPGFGNALPDDLHREDAVRIRDSGLNFVRLSHYPQSPAFLDACDELGVMVCAELASWKSVRGGRWLKSAACQFERMIRRDRNRPSIILWCMGNESRSRKAYLFLRDIARRLDPGRPVTYAENHLHRAVRRGTVGIPDVWGVNYELDVLARAGDACRTGSVIVTECSNAPHTVRGDLCEESDQAARIQSDLAEFEQMPHVAGFALWSYADYATLRKKRYYRHSGIVDAWRLPKMSAFMLKAMYGSEPFVRVFGDFEEGPGRTMRGIHVASNCDEVRLLVDGHEIDRVSGERFFARTIGLATGRLTASGVKDGRAVEYSVTVHGVARALSLAPDRIECAVVRAGTVIPLSVKVSDGAGNAVLSWKGHVGMKIAGPGRLCAYRAGNAVRIGGGTGRAFVRGAGQSGIVKVIARADGLEPACSEILFRRADSDVVEVTE